MNDSTTFEHKSWSGPSRDGTFKHRSGARVVISGPQGRYYAYTTNNKIVRSNTLRIISFISLQKAQQAALEA